MDDMHRHRDHWITKTALAVFFLLVLGYAYFEIRGLLYGPHIFITWERTVVHDPYVLISGKADHISTLTVDGVPVDVTTDGVFEIPYLLASGTNHIALDARDSYGHTTSKTVQIVYVPNASSTSATNARPASSASSTPATTTLTEPATSTPTTTDGVLP